MEKQIDEILSELKIVEHQLNNYLEYEEYLEEEYPNKKDQGRIDKLTTQLRKVRNAIKALE